MNAITVVMFAFAVLGALDRIFGNKLKLGKEFEKGFMLLGTMTISMLGMIIIAPAISNAIRPALDFVYDVFGIDPSIIPASLFANDMGGASMGTQVAKDGSIGMLNALVVSTMLGCTVSFNIPFSLSIVKKEKHSDLFFGFLCGISTIPIGIFFSGLLLKIPFTALLLNLLPIILFSALVALGLFFIPIICVKIFKAIGWVVSTTIIVGLMLGSLNFLSGRELVKGLDSFENGAMICFNAAIILAGAFPFMYIISLILKKPLRAISKKMKINDSSTLGFLSAFITNSPTFEYMNTMNRKGVVLCAAFAVSASAVFGGHLAFTLAFDEKAVLPMIVGKLVSGISGLLLAMFMYNRKYKEEENIE